MRKLALVVALITAVPLSPAAASRPVGTTVEVTVTPSGSSGSGGPEGCSSSVACWASVDISADGRYVAFATQFDDLVPGDVNGVVDVYVRDMRTGVTELVSVSPDGKIADAESGAPSISDDGRFVSFMSIATNLTEESAPGTNVYVRDRHLGVTSLESYGPGGEAAGFQGVDDAVLSGNGRYLIFQSGGFADDRTNNSALPFGGINFTNVYRRDLQTRKTEMVSLTHEGNQSLSVDISLDNNTINYDGSILAFGSQRHDLVPGDTNAQTDIFVADLNSGTLERVNVASDDTQANWNSYGMALSADGRFVSFSSAANNLVPVDTTSSRLPGLSLLGASAAPDVFVHDRSTGFTERVSLTSAGLEVGEAFYNDISDDGRYILFNSPYDHEGGTEFFDRLWIHDRQTGQTDLVSQTNSGESMRNGAPPALSGDGSTIAFVSTNSNSIFTDAVYLHTRSLTAAPINSRVTMNGDGSADVSGFLRLPGVLISEASPVERELALEPQVVAAQAIYRPELQDVLLKVDMQGLPHLGLPVPLGPYLGPGRRPMAPAGFGVEITGSDASLSVTPTLSSQGDGTFVGRLCAAACSDHPMNGSVGVAGDEAWLAVPLALLKQLGAPVYRVQVTTGLQTATSVTLSSVAVPEVSVTLISGPNSSAATVALSDRSTFEGSIEKSPGEPIFARVCVSECLLTQVS